MEIGGVCEGTEPVAPTDTGFDAFFESSYEPVLRAMYLVTGDRHEAEDLTQEGFARLYERWDHVTASGNPAGYAYRTALNVHRSRVRRVAAVLRRLSALRPPEAVDEVRAVDERDAIRRALGQLSRKEREALVLVEWVGFTDREAAKALRSTPGAIRTRLSRARPRMQRAITWGEHDD